MMLKMPDAAAFYLAARLLALTLVPSAVIAWVVCRRLLRRAQGALVAWQLRSRQRRLAWLQEQAVLCMTGTGRRAPDPDRAFSLLSDALQLAAKLRGVAPSSSSRADTGRSGGVGVGRTALPDVLGLQHLLAKAAAAAGRLSRSEELLLDTLHCLRAAQAQHTCSAGMVAAAAAAPAGALEDAVDGADDGLAEAAVLQDLGAVLWRQAQQQHLRLRPGQAGDDGDGGDGELSAEGIRRLEQAYKVLMAALHVFEREMIAELATVDADAVREVYRARLEAEAAEAAAASVEGAGIAVPVATKGGCHVPQRAASPVSLAQIGDDENDPSMYAGGDACDRAIRDLEMLLAQEASSVGCDSPCAARLRAQAAAVGAAKEIPPTQRLSRACRGTEGTGAAARWLDVARVRYGIGLVFESLGQREDSFVIFSEAQDMLDELIAANPTDSFRRHAAAHAALVNRQLQTYGQDHVRDGNQPPAQKQTCVLNSPLAKMTIRGVQQPALVPQKLFTPAKHRDGDGGQ
jgi:hypothetical protein